VGGLPTDFFDPFAANPLPKSGEVRGPVAQPWQDKGPALDTHSPSDKDPHVRYSFPKSGEVRGPVEKYPLGPLI
jgi:hypothetical protein